MYFQQVPIIINHDWEPTIRLSRKIMKYESIVDPVPYPPDAGEEGSAHYDLKGIGALSKNYKSPLWYRIVGSQINRTMPWLSSLLTNLESLGPDDGAISFLTGPGAEHVDQPKDKSALNYIFYNTDPDAFTYVRNNDYYGTYPSVVGQAWILDATVPHGISNTGERWNLSIHFSASYTELVNWFNTANPNTLTYG